MYICIHGSVSIQWHWPSSIHTNYFMAVTSYYVIQSTSAWSQHTDFLHVASSRCADVFFAVAIPLKPTDWLETDSLTAAHKHWKSWLVHWKPNWRIWSTSPIITLIAYKLSCNMRIAHRRFRFHTALVSVLCLFLSSRFYSVNVHICSVFFS